MDFVQKCLFDVPAITLATYCTTQGELFIMDVFAFSKVPFDIDNFLRALYFVLVALDVIWTLGWVTVGEEVLL